MQLEGRSVGPYDRRTIIGMRIRKALTSADVLIGRDGSRSTVADLIGRRGPAFSPTRTGSFSLVQATYTAALVRRAARGAGIPLFRGEMEARVQSDVLRLAGRFRRNFAWKEDRVKIPLKDFVHARVRGSLVDLCLRAVNGRRLHRVTLELFTPEAAGEFVDWLPEATPFPENAGRLGAAGLPVQPLMAAALGVVLTVGIVLMAVLRHSR
ncbi:hypothetical protein [Ramlibacter tataouinensis]|uniref:hypothetical protein n=1 Tax=Ramlibacter tataouinensis TaxID=94132 RepID=UPI0011AE4CDD|nr:hypothetical protein [Ramlibacter tataouinensis]